MKFFLALLASQQTLAESGVDGSCVGEEVSLMQSRHSAAKENETVQVAAGRRRSPALGTFYLSAPGAPECFVGESVSEEQCNGAVRNLAPSSPGRGLQVGSGGSCLDGGWGQVPKGCSAQSGGDWAAHFKTGSPTGEVLGSIFQSFRCVDELYQLVCTVPQDLYWAPYGQNTCTNGGTVSAFACAFAVNSMDMNLARKRATETQLAYKYYMAYDEDERPLAMACTGQGWGQVPTGCSAYTSSDGRPMFKSGPGADASLCASDRYQLVCTSFQGS